MTAALALLAALAVGCATSWPVEPGDSLTLGPDEGLLVVHTQTDRPLRSIDIGGVQAAEDVPEGSQVRLIGITAGSYRWAQIEIQQQLMADYQTYVFDDAARLRFRVEPGVINYVGAVLVESDSSLAVWMNTVDRTAMALEELRKRYPELLAKYRFVYSGPAPHVFLDRQRDALAQRGGDLTKVPPAPAPAPAAKRSDVDPLFAAPALQRAALNPAGTLSFVQEISAGTQTVKVRATGSGASTIVFSHGGPVDVEWEDDDTLVVQAGDGGRRAVIDLERLDRDFGVVSREREVSARGWFIDPLPLASDAVVWADWDGQYSAVFRAPIEALVAPAIEHAVDAKYRVAQLSERVFHWAADAQGVPRAALTIADAAGTRVGLLYRTTPDAPWQALGEWSAIDSYPVPVGVDENGRDLLVLSTEGSDTYALQRFDVTERRMAEVIFAQPGADVSGLVQGYRGEPIAVYWDSGGIRRYHYFDAFDSAQQKWLDERYPDQAVHLTSFTRDRRLFTVLVSGPRNPGELHLLDAKKRTVEKLGAVMPWLPPEALAPVTAYQVKTRDGRSIDAFLARPLEFTGKRPPLVVMPHGGPIGVQDTREFNPVVQWLAAHGYAVLQVNYRGSSGRGAGFLEAGLGAWGAGIEDDIEAALDRVVAARAVDADRVCIFGGSYGGYSALIGITRRPERYRCAAGFAAPTDLVLVAGEFFDDEDVRRMFARWLGDPDTDREHLIAVSPAYRVSEMDVPILLIQGDRDRVVDPEHAYRMRAMLEAYGKPYEWMLIEGATHSPTSEQWVAVLERLDAFLGRHLTPARAAAPRSRRRPGRSSPRAARRW